MLSDSNFSEKLRITEPNLQECKILPLVNIPCDFHHIEANVRNNIFFDKEVSEKNVPVNQNYLHFLQFLCKMDMRELFSKSKLNNVFLSTNVNGFHLKGPNKGLNILLSEIDNLLHKIKSDSFSVLSMSHVRYLLGFNGKEFFKTLGKNNRCFIKVGDASNDSNVLPYSRGFLKLAHIELECMCKVVIAIGDIDVCDTHAIVHIHIVEPSKAKRIGSDILKTGMCDMSCLRHCSKLSAILSLMFNY